MGVYGGGRMGSGIAHAFLTSGATVRVVEVSDSGADAARSRIEASVSTAVNRGSVGGTAGEHLQRLSVGSDPRGLAGCGLVVEAVSEEPELKADVLRAIEANAPSAWIGTNTSSLSISKLAEALHDTSALIGLHFFNPVPVSDLVEIVVTESTNHVLELAAQSWVRALGKSAIVVKDSPGFASSRLGVAIALEAMRMFEAGIASAEDIDAAMTLGYRHPMGPLRTTDLVGLDVRLAIAEHLNRELGPRFEPPSILREKVASGHLGRKTGRGFYDW
ncbi:3-hydroxyacyl-CoA dehydrogenase family protein [Streptosporangium sp. NPDC051023]|uniref:3-hydroxyacyl-CoA dehydrogenase family protein n=1 Tax=Streptosporangium sp. NPDC051023 TaxID=3155410 RepID=UPI00344D32F3